MLKTSQKLHIVGIRFKKLGKIYFFNPKNIKVKKGDKVYLNEYAGTKIKYEGEDLVIVRQSDILAVIE